MSCEISFLPVGNADCIVVNADDSVVLVDLGRNQRFIYKWLLNQGIDKISRIYVTHSHRDHFPFYSLINLVKFLNLWFSKNGEIAIFSLPSEVYRTAIDKLDAQRGVNADYRDLENALNTLYDWDRDRKVRFVDAVCDPTPYTLGQLQVFVTHPRALFIGQHKGKVNEISLVLRIVYGEFTAILLADLEGKGLEDYLSVIKSSTGAANEARANIVKIPHHGGYPSNGDDLKELLKLIDAELAVLSVGSTNRYGHVEPELFNALIELQNDGAQSLGNFICTEVTRTCKYSAAQRATMGKSGLTASEKCAGEITIVAEISGSWDLQVEATDHPSKIASLTYAACMGRAELG